MLISITKASVRWISNTVVWLFYMYCLRPLRFLQLLQVKELALLCQRNCCMNDQYVPGSASARRKHFFSCSSPHETFLQNREKKDLLSFQLGGLLLFCFVLVSFCCFFFLIRNPNTSINRELFAANLSPEQ